jgi:uncharacterized protein YdaU (DUF1376 family)
MMHSWRKGELPDDDRQLSKITKLPLKTWCDYRPILQDFFHNGWRHKRIDAELERMMRVSEKRAIAGQKGGLGSALARMKLENASRSRLLPVRAIASQAFSETQAGADHSHPHSDSNLYLSQAGSLARRAPSPKAEQTGIAVSAELAAYLARRTG